MYRGRKTRQAPTWRECAAFGEGMTKGQKRSVNAEMFLDGIPSREVGAELGITHARVDQLAQQSLRLLWRAPTIGRLLDLTPAEVVMVWRRSRAVRDAYSILSRIERR